MNRHNLQYTAYKMSNHSDQILAFFRKIFWYKKVTECFIINKECRTEDEIESDLMAFFDTFNINYEGFNILNYFEAEPTRINFKNIFNKRLKNSPLNKGKPPLTVRHLIEVAEKGEWFDVKSE